MKTEDYLEKIDINVLLDKYITLKLQVRFGTLRAKCKKEGIPFAIDTNNLKPYPVVCQVLNTPLDWLKEGHGPSDDSPSIDRIVPELGYVPGNVRIISQKANRGKSNLSKDELLNLARYIQEHEDQRGSPK